uniref:Kef-type potassium/proton antiporter accessory protein, CPA2 family n=1 Tax=Candidatus Kentrum sp. DK TaxID=2126562 RepID=A0A450S5U9_9GAMM|nr:MAG: Kef-type potassium/proton antiporter accessory protein, CPA2 family [Candidatus Kentron sp. DK]
MPNILVLFVHPYPQRSRVNRALRSAIHGLPNTHIHDLYEEYPDFYVDVQREQERLAKHDIIVFQHPVYWYSAPALLKEWQDVVLEHGWAHGEKGNALHGKYWLQAVSVAGTPASYSEEGAHGYPLTEFLKPFEATAHACGMIWLPPFITYDTSSMDNADIEARAARYREHLAVMENFQLAVS